MTKVFIDGSAGTTGLRIHERLADRPDLELIILSDDLRKSAEARKDAINRADVAFLCLPDPAAVEAVSMVENDSVAIIDTSTAHRTAPGWVYGFPELSHSKEKIANAKRIANPGCHASGFVALVQPLVEAGLLRRDSLLTCISLTGYSGGGKAMIAEYESSSRDALLDAPRLYGLTQQHKHLKEMKAVCNIKTKPAFCPIVAPFYSGMEVTVPIFSDMLNGTKKDVEEVYRTLYTGSIVHFERDVEESGFLSSAAFTGRDDMQITVTGNEDRLLLVARFDNLGKGAGGAAIQNMNILLGIKEDCGLTV